MKRLQAYKFELRANGHQKRQMSRFAGSCRFVFNEALRLQQANFEAGGKFINYVSMAKQLTTWRNGAPLPSGRAVPWLNQAPVHPLQHALKDLERAYKNFFAKRAAFPRFAKKGRKDSFRYPDPKQIKLDQTNNRVFLPKLGWIRYRNSRDVLGTVKNATVSLKAGKWFVSIQTEREVEQPITQATSAVGIDVGIARFATFSNGDHLAALNSFKKHEARLRRYQRAMARKQKHSSNWKKARARVQKIHARIGNVRRDFLHKATKVISKNHAMVCIEDLKVRNMSKSAAGSIENPGRNVRAKSGLNKAILDQGWFEFRRQLDYKLAWAGGWLIAAPPQHTSQTCPHCGCVCAENRLTQARFDCVKCGFYEHADVVGAMNILARGQEIFRRGDYRVSACGEPVQQGRSMKQEPTEEICHA
jgi:putative transposase